MTLMPERCLLGQQTLLPYMPLRSAPRDPLFVLQKKASIYLNSFPSVQDKEPCSQRSEFFGQCFQFNPLPPAPSAPDHLSLLEPCSLLQVPHPANQQQQGAAVFHPQPRPRCCLDTGPLMEQGVPYRGDLCPLLNPVPCSARWVRPKLHATLSCHPLRAWQTGTCAWQALFVIV